MAEARSEVSKAEEQLEELARHAAFLDAITPARHFQVAGPFAGPSLGGVPMSYVDNLQGFGMHFGFHASLC